jgi:hypothetical protein
VDRPLNYHQPADVPVRPAPGRILVIARLVWPDREEWVPAVANRWTRTHVLVLRTVHDQHGKPCEDALWLRAIDVRRTIDHPTPTSPGHT